MTSWIEVCAVGAIAEEDVKTARHLADATSRSTPNAISSSVSSTSSNNSEASQLATKKPREIFSPESISPAPSLGSNEDTP